MKKFDFIEENTIQKVIKNDKIVFKIDCKTKENFIKVCEKYGYSRSGVLRSFILNFIEEHTKKEEN